MSKCYDNPEYDDKESNVQNTWKQSSYNKEIIEKGFEKAWLKLPFGKYSEPKIVGEKLFNEGVKWVQEEPKQKTLPELVNIIMMVSMDERNWKRRNVIAVTNGTFVTSNNIKTDVDTNEEFRSIDYWKFAKPIDI
jgi:hypothetical protein